MNGLYLIIGFFLILHFSIFIGLFLDKEKVKKLLDFLGSVFIEIIYELGKTLFIACIVWMFFLPEDKDFTKALYGGIIFFIIGYGLKYRKENK